MVEQPQERALFRRARRSGFAGLALAALLTLQAPPAIAAEGEVVTVRLKEGQSLRDLAAEHLGDPDLWAEILRLNDLSVGDVRPGIELRIPVGPVANANRALAESLSLIQQATEQGARLFAADRIGQAIRLRDAAVAKRKGGEWDEAARLANDAKVAAEEALASALAQRDATAEALLSDRQGSVEGQRPQDLLWTDRLLNAILIEEEKVRTLSRSTAQITFKDDSRLRLNANSQAVIQRMRVDPLSREEEAKVSLVEGDFYALLAGKSERKSFELEVPEVQTEIESTNFWVRRDDAGSKFANFDERALAVSAQGESVSLGRNEATLVRNGAPPSEKIDILPAATLAAPQDDQVAFDAAVEMSWASLADAAGYWLEVAYDPGFRRMTFSRWGLAEHALRERAARGRLLLLAGRSARQVRSAGRAQRSLALSCAERRHAALSVDRRARRGRHRAPEPARGARRERARCLARAQRQPARGRRRRSVRDLLPARARAQPTDLEGDRPRRQCHREVTLVRLHARRAGGRDLRRRPAAARPAALRDRTRRDVDHRPHQRQRAGPDPLRRRRRACFRLRQRRGAVRGQRADASRPARRSTCRSSRRRASRARTGSRSRSTRRRRGSSSRPRRPPSPRSNGCRSGDGSTAASSSLVDGQPSELIEEAFDQTITLQQGANEIELAASDLVGNVSVEKLEIFLDQQPPELVRQSLSPKQASGGDAVTVEVVARDASGMKQAAAFSLAGRRSVARRLSSVQSSQPELSLNDCFAKRYERQD